MRADKAVRPAGTPKIGSVRRVIGKQLLKLRQRSGESQIIALVEPESDRLLASAHPISGPETLSTTIPRRPGRMSMWRLMRCGSAGSLIVTDDWSGYASLRKRGFDHHAIAECGEPEVAEQFMPMIHLVFSNLKTWLNGIHHGVSAKHLQAYLNEFTFRFNRRFYPFNAFRSLLGIAGGVEAPTYADLYSGAWTHPTCSGCLH